MTRDELMEYTIFHYADARHPCTSKHVERWRVNGQLKTWKRSPERFQQPVKHGLRDYGYITETNIALFHPESLCPTRD